MGSSMKCGASSLCGNYVGGSSSRSTRHGLPAAKTPAGTSRVTVVKLARQHFLTFRQQIGGVEEDRTPDLRIANATLSQLSYHPA